MQKIRVVKDAHGYNYTTTHEHAEYAQQKYGIKIALRSMLRWAFKLQPETLVKILH